MGKGGNSISNISTGRLLIKTEITPSYTRPNLNQGAAFLSTRTVRKAPEMKPQLKKRTADVSASETFRITRACGIILNVADKATLTPGTFAKIEKPDGRQKPKTYTIYKQRAMDSKNGANHFRQTRKRGSNGKKFTEWPKAFPTVKTHQATNTAGSPTDNRSAPPARRFFPPTAKPSEYTAQSDPLTCHIERKRKRGVGKRNHMSPQRQGNPGKGKQGNTWYDNDWSSGCGKAGNKEAKNHSQSRTPYSPEG